DKVLQLAKQFKAVAIMGPRQSGKTTLSRMCFPEKPYVSLENPQNRRFAIDDPVGFLATYPNGAILDEIQRAPELLSWLQQRLDEESRKGTFILTGSNNLLFLEQITQSLAGRVAYLDLLPFSLPELSNIPNALDNLNSRLFRGGYPPVQADQIEPENWFPAYVRTYIERDVRQIKNIDNLLVFEKCLSLCAGRVGQLVNYSNLANEVGVDYKTIQSWLGVLQASYIIHFLPPYFRSFNKRIIKTPKLYFYDTGLLCYLLRISTDTDLVQHPYRGNIFENFIANELLKRRFNQGQPSNLYFWRDRTGNELDIIIDEGTYLIPVEIKSGQSIRQDFFKNMEFWKKLTGQSGGVVYYGGEENQKRSNGIEVKSWRTLIS
ncbi:MAG: ATP-binding protein, partial [Bacteroidota bacterium]